MYLISSPTYTQFEQIRDSLLKAEKIASPTEAVFVSYHIPARKATLAGRRGFKQAQLIGQFSNSELFDLQLPMEPADAVESIVDALVYSQLRKRKQTKHVGDLVRWERRARERLAKEASKYGASIEDIFNDIAARVESAANDEEE